MNVTYENGIISTEPSILDYEVEGGVGNVLFKSMKEYAEKTAQIEARTGKSDTYKTLLTKCIKTSFAMKKLGIKKGDLIGLCCDLCLNGCVPIISSYFIGALPFSISSNLTIEESTHLLQQVHPKILFITKSVQPNIEQSLKNANIFKTTELVIFEEKFELDFLSNNDDEHIFEPIKITDLKETAAIYFSSGSSGLPKGICISQYAVLSLRFQNMKQIIGNHAVTLCTSNWHWISSLIHLFTMTTLGGCRLMASDYDINERWSLIEEYKVTQMHLSVYECIRLSSKPENIDISSLKSISSAGSRVPAMCVSKIESLFPKAHFVGAYGMTELISVTLYTRMIPQLRKKPESMGVLQPGLKCKVVDPETDQVLGPNQIGELRLKSERIMNGYYNRDSSDVFDKDGFFKTGDMVYYDREFCFFFVTRLKEGLGYRGEWVYPAQIEDVLMKHPAVKLAIVIGKPHKTDEEHPTAVVVLNDSYSSIEPDELVNFVNDRVKNINKLRGGVIYLKEHELPLTVTGKVNRLKLKQMLFSNLFSY